MVADWLGKYSTHCGRIAGLLHMLESLEDEGDPWDRQVSAETVEAAVEITEYFLAQTLAAIRSARVDPMVRIQKIALRKMLDLRADGVRLTFNAIWQAVKGRSSDFKSREVLHDALDGLLLRNYVQELQPAAGRPGRPGRVFRLHPDAESAFASPGDVTPSREDRDVGDDDAHETVVF